MNPQNTQKSSARIVITIIIILVVAIVAYMFGTKNQTKNQTENQNNFSPTLTEDAALTLVKTTWGDCDPNTCTKVTVSLERQGENTTVIATYEGMRDDSVSVQRKTSTATYVNNAWVLGDPTNTFQCQKGRGHQDFSAALCI